MSANCNCSVLVSVFYLLIRRLYCIMHSCGKAMSRENPSNIPYWLSEKPAVFCFSLLSSPKKKKEKLN